jgi:hypothetical protein
VALTFGFAFLNLPLRLEQARGRLKIGLAGGQMFLKATLDTWVFFEPNGQEGDVPLVCPRTPAAAING